MLLLEDDGTISYNGNVVARRFQGADKDRIEISLTYEAAPEDWAVPLFALANGLQQIEPPPPPIILEVATTEKDIEEEFNVPRLLTEKEVKRNGYIWRFHKTDPDPWPSAFHGHDYEKGLKINAINGEIFDVASRRKCKKLKSKALAGLHNELRETEDLKLLVETFLPDETSKP